VPNEAEYTVELTTDDHKYGGFCQIAHQVYPTKVFDGQHYVELYLPARTAMVLKEKKIRKAKEEKPAEKKPAEKKAPAKKAPAKKTKKAE